jgi:cytochrome c oxidase cbb3-type subunit 4
MDINIVRATILLFLMFAFIGLWVWAWSGKRKHAFEDASMLPLEEDNGVVPNDVDPADETRSTGEGVSHVK